jgi:protein-disulfide isomerase
VFPLIRAKYLDAGRLRFVLRDFPLNLVALKAAQTAWCGGRDRYVEIHDALWADWDSWINLPAPDEALVRIASEHGIAPKVAAACLTDPVIEQRVLESYMKGAQAYGIEGTPTFIANGKRYRGFLSFERFERALAETVGKGGG